MPGWHDATDELERQGKIKTLGIIQEQHPARARLFMQWKKMGWPVLVDALNRMQLTVVPVTLLIDEHGVIRRVGPRLSEARSELESFVATRYEPPAEPAGTVRFTEPERLLASAREIDLAVPWRECADAVVMWGGPERLDDAIEAYDRALALEPGDGRSAFGRGVAHRMRYDIRGDAADFGRAVADWTRGLAADPNHYIRRRRLQQYGPRLDKPYPFYDWIAQARREVAARGEVPVTLPVEPRGAELAMPARRFEATEAAAEPDPEGKILRDPGKLVQAVWTTVPAAVSPGRPARIHVELRPQASKVVHWNNETGDLAVWIEPPPGWAADRTLVTVPNPAAAVSLEPRRVEFELRSPADVSKKTKIPAYALYYVCEGERGACLYRRQDFSFTVTRED